MAATRFHNKVERVFLVMHIGFVGVYSGKINRDFFWDKRVFLVHLGVFLVHFFLVFLVSSGGFLVHLGGFFGRHQGTIPQHTFLFMGFCPPWDSALLQAWVLDLGAS